MEVRGYTLAHEPKVIRAIEAVGSENPDAVLVEYDRIAGLILDSQGRKVKTGAFWNFEAKEARDLDEAEDAVELAPEREGADVIEQDVSDELDAKPAPKKAAPKAKPAPKKAR